MCDLGSGQKFCARITSGRSCSQRTWSEDVAMWLVEMILEVVPRENVVRWGARWLCAGAWI